MDEHPSEVRGGALLRSLPRGGLFLTVGDASIQLGCPPETVKDSIALGLEPPLAYVLPRQLFDVHRGVSIAEFEFPAYRSFFLHNRRVVLVVESPAHGERVRAVFEETLVGPAFEPDPWEFADGDAAAAKPLLCRESDYFRRSPGRRRLSVDELVDVRCLTDGPVVLEGGLSLELAGSRITVRKSSDTVAELSIELALPPRLRPAAERAPTPFVPPAFGVTVLGASHGFDPDGKTTGFVLWMGGRALLIDPPLDSTEALERVGVGARAVDGVVLTHCHADHDAGTFQKLLHEQKVTLYTTPHILESFLRKYRALSGLDDSLLRRTFRFHPVRIGAPVHVGGGELWFRYGLHSIPALGVEAFYGGRSVWISGDTLYDPARLSAMRDEGVLSAPRYQDLSRFRGHHCAILHEAGVPPIHTPIEAIAELPADTRARVRLVHVAAKDVPAGLGVEAALEGFEHTLRIDVPATAHGDAIELLDICSRVDFLRELPLSRARALLQVVRRERHPAGAQVVRQGERGEAFYVVARGTLEVVRDGKPVRRYAAGEYFGEIAAILGEPRGADVVATTEVELLALSRDDLLAMLRGSPHLSRVERLARMHSEPLADLMDHDELLATLSGSQRTALLSIAEPVTLTAGDLLWVRGESGAPAFVLDDARAQWAGPSGLRELGRAALVVDADALVRDAPSTVEVRVTRGGRAYRAAGSDASAFLRQNPGLLLALVAGAGAAPLSRS